MNSFKSDPLTLQYQRSLERNLKFEPTLSQSQAIYALARFLASEKYKCTLLIKGYAGTGKTTLMRALVAHLRQSDKQVVLLAPTGRAAKVLSQYAGHYSATIHRHIYRRTLDKSGRSHYMLAPNKRKDTVFIVDEASMLGNERGVLYNGLLDDLIEHVFNGPGCRLVMLGDDAQLPPVGMDESPAMDLDELRMGHDLVIASTALTEVVRQAADSAILSLATSIRMKIFGHEMDKIALQYDRGPDVIHLSSQELAEELENAYDDYGKEQVRVICRSNKAANQYNHQIRSRVFQMDDELSAGEMLMVVRNNYLWTVDEPNMPFIANGELAELLYVKGHRELYGFEFAVLGLSFPDQESVGTVECQAMLDVLRVDSASMTEERMKELYQMVQEDHSQDTGAGRMREAMQKDPWYNALQIKYGYAITCHKAQGGQWPVVFVDKGYLTDDGMDKEFWRWLYTAVTRATERLYLIDF